MEDPTGTLITHVNDKWTRFKCEANYPKLLRPMQISFSSGEAFTLLWIVT